MINQLHLIHQPGNIDSRLKISNYSQEELAVAKSQETPETIALWTKTCVELLRSHDLMLLDSLLSYEPIISEEAFKQCLTEINQELLQQFSATQSLLGHTSENATDPVSKYFRLPVFHDLLAQLTRVNPKIYEYQFDLFLEVEYKTKEQDKLRVIRQEMKLPLSTTQKDELIRRREKVAPAKEVNDSKNYYPLWLTILIVAFFLLRLIWRLSR